jgi:hypothetical protein
MIRIVVLLTLAALGLSLVSPRFLSYGVLPVNAGPSCSSSC